MKINTGHKGDHKHETIEEAWNCFANSGGITVNMPEAMKKAIKQVFYVGAMSGAEIIVDNPDHKVCMHAVMVLTDAMKVLGISDHATITSARLAAHQRMVEFEAFQKEMNGKIQEAIQTGQVAVIPIDLTPKKPNSNAGNN